MQLIVKTMHGLEPILAEEIRRLGGTEVKEIRRAVLCSGDLACLYRINLCARTALKVLVPFNEFHARNEEQLYRRVKEIDWKDHFDITKSFAIESVVHSEVFRHSKYVALKAKDAIVDAFRERDGDRPNVNVKDPDIRIHIHCSKTKFSLSLDASGLPLSRRGYRQVGHDAPLNEVLAAGMILSSNWKVSRDLLDPMCGSGTLSIEAAMIATNTPPGLIRREYAFMKWNDYDSSIWKKVRSEAEEDIVPSPVGIQGMDMSSKYVAMAQRSAELMGLGGAIEFREMNFFHSSGEDLHVIMNPPYGERLDRIGKMTIEEFYRAMGDRFKQHYSGCTLGMISSNTKALKNFGLRPSRKMTLYNGALECKYQTFDLYAGSKKNRDRNKSF